MAGVTHEQVAAAVFQIVTAAAGNVVGLVTSSRRFRPPSAVGPSEMPALFQVQLPEKYERTQGGLIGLPPKRTMHFEIGLYVADAQESSVIPSQQLNAMIDAIEAAFFPDPTTGINTLGGLAASARVSGDIVFAENLAGDGKSLAVVPIEVTRP